MAGIQRRRAVVPLNSGKCLPEMTAWVLVVLKPPPQRQLANQPPATGRTNYLRFGIPPNSVVALPARIASAEVGIAISTSIDLAKGVPSVLLTERSGRTSLRWSSKDRRSTSAF